MGSRVVFHNVGARLVLFSSGILVPTPHFWDDRCPSVWQSGLFVSLFVLPEQPPFCSSLSSLATLATFRASPIFCPPLLSHPEEQALVHLNVVTYRIESFFPRDVIFMISWWSEFQTLSRGFMRFHHACMFCLLHFCWILWLRCLSPAACQYGFPAARPNLCALSWSRQKIPEELGKFLLPARRAEHEVRRDDDRSTNNRCGLSRLLFRPLVETFPNFLEGLFWDLHALQVGLALEWIFGRHNLFETSLLHHLRLGTWNCRRFSESFPLRWVFEHWISDASNILQSVSATRKSRFQILPANTAYPKTISGETLLPNWWSPDWSFAEIGWYSSVASNGMIGPSTGSPNRRS